MRDRLKMGGQPVAGDEPFLGVDSTVHGPRPTNDPRHLVQTLAELTGPGTQATHHRIEAMSIRAPQPLPRIHLDRSDSHTAHLPTG